MMAPATKVAVVTGCSPGGIGFYLAKELRKKGYRVFATTRKGDIVPGLEDCDPLKLEVTDAENIKQAASEVAKKAGGLDMLVNNAGHGLGRVPLLDTDIEKAKELFDANVWGLLRVTQAFVPLMLKDGLPPVGSKRVVNVSSVAGLRSFPFMGVYGASKHAVHGINDALRLEVANLNISVTLVAPGMVRTRFFDNENPQDIPEGSYYRHNWEQISHTSLGKASDVVPFAKGVADAITARKAPTYYFAGEGSFLIRFLALLPPWILDAAARKPLGAHLVEYKPS